MYVLHFVIHCKCGNLQLYDDDHFSLRFKHLMNGDNPVVTHCLSHDVYLDDNIVTATLTSPTFSEVLGCILIASGLLGA